MADRMESGSRRNFIRGAALGSLGWMAAARTRPAAKPNIVYILADDIGVGDVSFMNRESKLPTPNIDSIAREGVHFTDAHSGSAVCSPTRYGLLTGRYSWRTRLKYHVLRPYEPPLIEPGRTTAASLLKARGYHTACIGKWHLGWDWPKRNGEVDFTRRLGGGPIAHGFDYYFGPDVPNYPPYCFIENDRVTEQPTATKPSKNLDGAIGPMAPHYRFEEVNLEIVRRASTYIGQRAAARKPFFLYLPLTIPHEPLRPEGRFAGKSGINPVADLLLEMDWSVGEILSALDRHNVRDNTGSIYEGGHRVPFAARWPGHIAPASRSADLTCLGDFLPACANLAGASLTGDEAEDAYNMLPAMLGKTCPVKREALVHHSGWGQFAIRRGDFKLIVPKEGEPPAGPKEPKQVELYNLRDDPAETTNLASRHESLVNDLGALLKQYQTEGRSRPRGTWPPPGCDRIS